MRHLSQAEIEGCASACLHRHHPQRTVPIPVEEMIEFQMGLHIVPTDGLMSLANVDAVTCKEKMQINIDRRQLEKHTNRARFSLAHEVGHLILHDENDLNKAPSEKQRTFQMEVEANIFAAALLMPAELVRIEYSQKKRDLENRWKSGDKGFRSPDQASRALLRALARKFFVSIESMENRIRYLKKSGTLK